MNLKRRIEMLLVLTSIVFMFWVAASWVDVVAHNTSGHPVYQEWNFFQKMVDANN